MYPGVTLAPRQIDLAKATTIGLLALWTQIAVFDRPASAQATDTSMRDETILGHNRFLLKSEYALPIRIHLRYEHRQSSLMIWSYYKDFHGPRDKWNRSDIEKDFDLGYVEVDAKTQFNYVGPRSPIGSSIRYYVRLFNLHRRLPGPARFYKWCDRPQTIPCWVDIPGPNAVIFFVAHLSMDLELTIERIEEVGVGER